MTGAAVSSVDAGADRGVALELDVGTHALQLQHVLEAVLEYRLGDRRDAARHGIQRAELRLHVGRERRIGRRADVHRAPAAFAVTHVQLDPVVTRAYLGTGLGELDEYGLEYLRRRYRAPESCRRSSAAATR